MAKNSLKWVAVNSDGGVMEYMPLGVDHQDDPIRRAQFEKNYRVKLQPNFEFEDSLQFQHFSRGRSSLRAEMKDSHGVQHAMFISDFERLIKDGRLQGQYLKGKWTFAKKGSSVGLVEVQ